MKWGKAHSIRGEPELRYISRALFLDFLLCTLRFFINHVCRSNIHENNFTPTYHLEETSIKKKDASSTLQFKCKHPDEFWVVLWWWWLGGYTDFQLLYCQGVIAKTFTTYVYNSKLFFPKTMDASFQTS